MNPLLQHMAKSHNTTARTDNGAVSNHSSLSACVDMFSKIGACRGKNDQAWLLFSNAFSADPLKALKILFYARDIRGGQGERTVFRTILTKLVAMKPEMVLTVMPHIPEYGRWDDVLCLLGTRLEEDAIKFFCDQLTEDWESDKPSLAAKWAPSINTSSKDTVAKAKKFCAYLGMKQKDYRQGISKLRKLIGLVEHKMSNNEWGEIEYSGVPSRANVKYRKAFERHDETRRAEFLQKATDGEVKMNTVALYPYDLTNKYLDRFRPHPELDPTVEAAWANLPNYLEGNEHNGLVMCDTSGSMYHSDQSPLPIQVAISLSIYIAERNKGDFANHFLTFSDTPQLQKIEGITLLDKVNNLKGASWAMNTNIQSAFDTILGTAVQNKVMPENMPDVIYIISDMQFDAHYIAKPNFEILKDKFSAAGYELPKLVFWNVNAGDDQPVTIHDWNTALVSGCNPTIFSQILSGCSPEDVMNKVIEGERYAAITL